MNPDSTIKSDRTLPLILRYHKLVEPLPNSASLLSHPFREYVRAVWQPQVGDHLSSGPLTQMLSEKGVLSSLKIKFEEAMLKSRPNRNILDRTSKKTCQGIADYLSHPEQEHDISMTDEELVGAYTHILSQLGTNRKEATASIISTLIARASVNGRYVNEAQAQKKSIIAKAYTQRWSIPEIYNLDGKPVILGGNHSFIISCMRKMQELQPTLDKIITTISDFNAKANHSLILQGSSLSCNEGDLLLEEGDNEEWVAKSMKGTSLEDKIKKIGGYTKLDDIQAIANHIFQGEEDFTNGFTKYQNALLRALLDTKEKETYGIDGHKSSSFIEKAGFILERYQTVNTPPIEGIRCESRRIGKEGTLIERYIQPETGITLTRTRNYSFGSVSKNEPVYLENDADEIFKSLKVKDVSYAFGIQENHDNGDRTLKTINYKYNPEKPDAAQFNARVKILPGYETSMHLEKQKDPNSTAALLPRDLRAEALGMILHEQESIGKTLSESRTKAKKNPKYLIAPRDIAAANVSYEPLDYITQGVLEDDDGLAYIADATIPDSPKHFDHIELTPIYKMGKRDLATDDLITIYNSIVKEGSSYTWR